MQDLTLLPPRTARANLAGAPNGPDTGRSAPHSADRYGRRPHTTEMVGGRLRSVPGIPYKRQPQRQPLNPDLQESLPRVNPRCACWRSQRPDLSEPGPLLRLLRPLTSTLRDGIGTD